MDRGLFPLGEGCSLIRQVMPVAELMEELMGEAKETMKRLQGILDD